jgi:hypothetical protein
MHHQIRFMTLLAALSIAGAARAFSPPADTRELVTLSIEGVPEKAPVEKPLAFTVLLTNTSGRPVTGTVAVGLNDDWQVEGSNTFEVSVEPGKTWQAPCSAIARDRVLNARYPVHARFTFGQGPARVELHPIAIFKAVRPAAAHVPLPGQEELLVPGVWRLAHFTPSVTAWARNGRTTPLPFGFSGSDRESGATCAQESIERGGVLRHSLGIHPPWKGGHGSLWSDYRLALSTNTPIRLKFHTAMRDSRDDEPKSDGVDFRVSVVGADSAERTLFSRFSDAKTWQPAEIDLSAYAGQTVALRLWNGPGPKNDTTCDNGFWGDPLLVVGAAPPPPSEAEWAVRTAAALQLAREAAAGRTKVPNAFRLKAEKARYGAAVVPGREGLTDAVIAFSDGQRELAFRGFTVEIDGQTVGGTHDGQAVLSAETARAGEAWIITHHVASSFVVPASASSSSVIPPKGGITNPSTLPLRATVRADQGVLRIAWDMPGAVRAARGTPRFTKLALGPADRPPARIYLGFGAVYDAPGAFTLPYGGVQLGTRHIGADYAGGLSLVQATDLLPDRLVCAPEGNLFSLETPHDACFMFAPSAHGAYAAARAYRDVCGFEKSPGVDGLLGRICLDQWGGDYRAAAKDLDRAATYGLGHAVFVKHDWQRWGYDYRLPEIYPPAGGLEPFREMREAAKRAGMLFAPHDNYIDFYPDAEGFSYDCIVFNADGTPHEAWYHPGRDAQSYRWRPDAFTPWLTANMQRMREGFGPDSLFIDVFTSIQPFDFYDRSGAFHTRAETVKGWRAAFDASRLLLGHRAPMISESGHDALVGSIDGVQADHWRPDCWLKRYKDADRTPWHDMVTHGKMVLFAGGLGHRYDEDERHGYGSDDYLSNTVLGGRGPMCDGPFSRRAVMTSWLLHDVCEALARAEMEAHEFGDSVRQQHTTFGNGGQVWANRGSNGVWSVADGKKLPEYGFYVQARKAAAGVVLLKGHRAGFAQSDGLFFADARPPADAETDCRVETKVVSAERLGPRAFRVTVEWNVLAPLEPGYVPFVHIGKASLGEKEIIEAQAGLEFDLALLNQPGIFRASADVRLPPEFAAGDYRVCYGLFHRKRGDRVPLRGLDDQHRRIHGGVLRITATGDEYLTEEPIADNPDVNVAGAMLDFGPLATDGAFRLLHGDPHAWQLIPLPASRPFRAELRLASLGKRRAKVKAVEKVDPFNAYAKEPEWTQDNDLLRLACDGRSFGYRIVFE